MPNVKRPSSDDGPDGADQEKKRYKKAIEDAADEFVCPITTDLPLDPVNAEDGRTYERSAIEEHITRNSHNLRSPVTNETMGSRLFPAVQARNLIKTLVLSGAITGNKADRWKERIREEEEVARTKKSAEGGDADAMGQLALWYYQGIMGLNEDHKKAYSLFKSGADLGHFSSMYGMGHCLLGGQGVEKNETEALTLIAAAAQGGSASAAMSLGRFYFRGMHGLRKDVAFAKNWFKKAAENVNTKHDSCTADMRRDIDDYLDRIKLGQN